MNGRSGYYEELNALTLQYTGNQLKKVTDTGVNVSPYPVDPFDYKDYANQQVEYTYDENGRMTKDLNKGIKKDIIYNRINLPKEIEINHSMEQAKVEYQYSALGTKLKTTHRWDPTLQAVPISGGHIVDALLTELLVTDYVSNLVYENNSLKYILTANGYIDSEGHYFYYVRDHLGSNRAVMNSSGNIVQATNYYPFGLPQHQDGLNSGGQPYKYTGQEFDGMHGMLTYDYHARIYDAQLGRFMTMDPRAESYYDISPYAYCLNNPMIYTDPDGEFIWPIINGVKDFLRNTFVKVWTQGFNAWSNGDNWHSTKMAWKIDMGLFQGDFKQIVSRFTWELPQTLLGYTVSGVHNTFDGVKSVTYYGGATAVESYSKDWKGLGLGTTTGFTLGSYINGVRGLEAKPDNALFQHEYGHYLQSQSSGWFYLSKYAIPSALSSGTHGQNPVEQDANIRAYKYFMKNVDGFNVTTDGVNYPNGQWYSGYNPIKDYNWYLDYNDASNQLALKKGIIRPKWWDYVLGPRIVIPGIINVLNLKH
jgi:RHS repeat-associated protein